MHGAPIIQPKDASMPVQSLLSRSTVIGRLRAAGCVFAEDEADLLLSAGLAPQGLINAVHRRVEGFPLEHILGWAEFCGLRIRVGAGVFVPRRRTELLVREAAALLGAAGAGASERAPSTTPVVVDLCCGSGAVGTALAALVQGSEVHASDVDPAAVRCARLNVLPVGGVVHEGDLYAALPARLRGNVDMLAVNAPYVPTGSISSMPHEARVHEPRVSLDGGPDGLDIQRRVIAEASAWLRQGGHLLIETSRLQAPHTAAAMVSAGLSSRIATSHELDGTVAIGQLL
jgi:release factor glutamine methyltransferase